MDDPDRDVFKGDPNLDVMLYCAPPSAYREVAIECKFTEPYRSSKPKEKGLKWPYLRKQWERQLWEGLPKLQSLGQSLSPEDTRFKHLRFLPAVPLV